MSSRVPADTGRMKGEVILAIMAVAIAVLEGFIPRPVPFLKPGLANIATIAGILLYGPWSGLRINLLRCFGAAIFTGTLATPTFALSLAGGVASASVMGLFRQVFSVPGLSVLGSVSGMGAQLAAISIMFPGLPTRMLLAPVMIWAVAAGAVTGGTAAIFLRRGFPWVHTDGLDSAQSLT